VCLEGRFLDSEPAKFAARAVRHALSRAGAKVDNPAPPGARSAHDVLLELIPGRPVLGSPPGSPTKFEPANGSVSYLAVASRSSVSPILGYAEPESLDVYLLNAVCELLL